MEGGNVREWVYCVLTADGVRGLDRGWEVKGVVELCVDCRLFLWDWIEGG